MAESVSQLLSGGGISTNTIRLEHRSFNNGEVHTQILDPVEGHHVFYFHSFEPRPNDELMHMLITCDAFARAGVRTITLVAPYLPYMRQDRITKPGSPISARLLADLMESNPYIKKIITVDIHTDQAVGFFKIPVMNLSAREIFSAHAHATLSPFTHTVAVAPDLGSAARTRSFADALGGIPVAICEKQRTGGGETKLVAMSGAQVKEHDIVVFDDMIDTGSTIRGTVQTLRLPPYDSKKICVFATHSIMSGNAETHFSAEHIPVITTNSIPRSGTYAAENQSWLTTLPLDPLIARAVKTSIEHQL